MVIFLGTETAPSSGVSSPTTMRNSVVLPAPLGPTSPTFSPGFNWNEASTKSNCLPYCLLMFEKEIILEEQLAARCLFQCSRSVAWTENCRSTPNRRHPRGVCYGRLHEPKTLPKYRVSTFLNSATIKSFPLSPASP